MNEIFNEVVVFTENRKEYADAIMNSIKSFDLYVNHRLYGNHMTPDMSSHISETETFSEGGP